MSQVGLSMSSDASPGQPSKQRSKKSRVGLIVVLLITFAVLAGAAWFAYTTLTKPPADYVGEGTGRVVVLVESGESIEVNSGWRIRHEESDVWCCGIGRDAEPEPHPRCSRHS